VAQKANPVHDERYVPRNAEVRPDGKICLKERTVPDDEFAWLDYQPFTFVFEGVSYVTSNDIHKCRSLAIELPDGRYILPGIWKQSRPPKIDWEAAKVVDELPQDWYPVEAKVDRIL
jgi:hypothetical protein